MAEAPLLDEYDALVRIATAHMTASGKLSQIDTPIDMTGDTHPFTNDSNGEFIPFIHTAIQRCKEQHPGLLSLDLPIESFEELKRGVAYSSHGIVFKIVREQKKDEVNQGMLKDVDFARDTCILTYYAEVQKIGISYLGALCCDIPGERLYILMTERCTPYTYNGDPLISSNKGPSGPFNLKHLMFRVTRSAFKVHGDFCVKNIVEKDKMLYVIDIDAAELYNLLNHTRYPFRPYLDAMISRFNSALPSGSGKLTRTFSIPNYRKTIIQLRRNRHSMPYGGSMKRFKTRKYKKKKPKRRTRFIK